MLQGGWSCQKNFFKLSCDALLRIWKSFTRPVYDEPHNELCKNRIENVQCKASIVTTGVSQ